MSNADKPKSLDELFKQKLEHHQEPDLSALRDAMWKSVSPKAAPLQVATKYFVLSKKALIIIGSSVGIVGTSLIAYTALTEEKPSEPKVVQSTIVVSDTSTAKVVVPETTIDDQVPSHTQIVNTTPEVPVNAVVYAKKVDSAFKQTDTVLAQKDSVAKGTSIAAIEDSSVMAKNKKKIIVKRKIVINDSIVKHQKRW